MVKQFWLGAAVALLGSICLAQGACTKRSEFQPVLCRIKLPRIVAIEIEDNGASTSPTAEPEIDCSRFKLTAAGVRRYFGKAWRILDKSDMHHKLDWLPCYASGTLRFADGKTARWYIEQSATARLVPEGEEEINFFCPSCKYAPFLW